MTTTSPGSGLTATAAADQFPLGTVEPDYVLTEALGTDPASLFTGIGAEDRAYWDRARSFVQDEVLPGHRRLLGTRRIPRATCSGASASWTCCATASPWKASRR